MTYFRFHNVYDGPMGIHSVFHLSVYLSCSNTHTRVCTPTHAHTHTRKGKEGEAHTGEKDPGQESGSHAAPVRSKLSTKGQTVNIRGFTITVSITTALPCRCGSKSAKGNM